MTASSLLVPAVGVLTQPILAQALGVDGRGALAAAIAPAALVVSVATLGLPDALTYFLAKYPRITRRALLSASTMSFAMGLLCLGATIVLLPFLSTGDRALGDLIVLGMALTVPALVVGVFRGAAVGRQMWTTVATERLINVTLRIVSFGSLWLLGELTVRAAVVISTVAPIVCGIVYWRLLTSPPRDDAEPPLDGGTTRPLLSFGSRVWLGAVAEMLLARIGQVLMTPLAGVAELGLYIVATTIADVPLIVAIAIQGTLFGVNSRTKDAAKLTTTTRLTVFVAFSGCALLGATLPFWLGPLFGEEFLAATVPTLMLMASAVICIPGLMAATGVSAWGRPGLRSLGLAITLVTNVAVFVLLVPSFGVIGACWTSIVSNVVMTSFMVLVAKRVMKVPARDFLLVRGADVVRTWHEGARLLAMVSARLRRSRGADQT